MKNFVVFFRKALLAVALLVTGDGVLVCGVEAADPLPSWNDGPAKHTILDFVQRVTTQGSPEYVSPEERIATFDNDGTLWSEQPMYL